MLFTCQLIILLISLHRTCFTDDTLVATEDEQKRIDKIEIGDMVWAYNVETGETELKEVKNVFVHDVIGILHLYTTDGDIDTTTNHPFYVIGKGWVAVGDLSAGDEVYLLNGSSAFITGSEFEELDEIIQVYNLEVEDFHSYFVGEEAVLVHNMYDDLPENREITDKAKKELKKAGLLSKFEDAMKQGYADARFGSDGIIKLTNQEMKKHKGYTYKLKVAKASNHYRVLGKIETFINEDKKEMLKLVFSKVLKGKNAD